MYDLKVFTDNIEPEALNQVYELVKQPAFENCKVRIMPDVHAGKGCVIGFTADLGDKVIPNIVGVDIGCGMMCTCLGKNVLNLDEVDKIIRERIPSGRNVHNSSTRTKKDFEELADLRCLKHIKDVERINNSLGTLGGGNHFIEIDRDDAGFNYLVVHSGSRNLGKQVADYYQNLAIDIMQGTYQDLQDKQEKLIKEYKETGRSKEIAKALKGLKENVQGEKKLGIPKHLCYLEGKFRDDYIHDMQICQRYATMNRVFMTNEIVTGLFGCDMYALKMEDTFETIHNYIELESNIVRKGAISAKKDEMLLIPINMRDGCILGRGKGNDDWNCSAPHGAGRLMSRSKAKESVSIDEFKESMEGIYTTSVNMSTLDESPMAYKSMDEIINNIGDTVEIVSILKPIYNFKASE